jgi:hypothetical protein
MIPKNFFSLTLMVIVLSIYQNTGSFSEGQFRLLQEDVLQEIPLKETKLLLDENLAEYITSQAKLDGANQVILIADTIMVTQKVTLGDIDLIFISNYFSTEGGQVEVLPSEANRNRSGIAGKSGKEVQIIAKQVEEAQFHLPGMDGTKGSDGRNGKSGKKNEVKKPGDVSKGTVGKDGQNGGKGGNGGQLILHALNKDYSVRLTAPGGRGGTGGKGGIGGTTFMWIFTKPPPGKSKTPDPNQPDPGGKVQIQSQKNQSGIKSRKEKDGRNGKRGRNGIRGKEEKKVISDKEFIASVREHYHHDWQNLNQTGWQILFR